MLISIKAYLASHGQVLTNVPKTTYGCLHAFTPLRLDDAYNKVVTIIDVWLQ